MMHRGTVIHRGQDAVVDSSVIDQATLSRVLSEEEQGPDVPAGALRLAEQQLRGSAPAAFYAHDGAHWHVVLLVPLEEEFLRLRLRPRSDVGLRQIRRIYNLALDTELQARQVGLSWSEAADEGAAEITRSLGPLGAAGAVALTEFVLRTELPQTELRPEVPDDAVGPLVLVMRAVAALEISTARPLAQLPRLLALRDELASTALELPRLRAELRLLGDSSMAGAERFAERAPVLANSCTAMLKVAAIADEQLTLAADSTRAALIQIDRVLVWLCLGRLVEHELAWQARRHVNALSPALGRGSRLDQLGQLLQPATIELAAGISDLPARTDQAAEDVHGAIEDLAAFHRWLARFRMLVTRDGLWDELDELRMQLDRQLVGIAGLERLRRLEDRCRQPVVDVDLQRLAKALSWLRTSLTPDRAHSR